MSQFEVASYFGVRFLPDRNGGRLCDGRDPHASETFKGLMNVIVVRGSAINRSRAYVRRRSNWAGDVQAVILVARGDHEDCLAVGQGVGFGVGLRKPSDKP